MKKINKLVNIANIILFLVLNLNLNINNVNALTSLEYPKIIEIQDKIHNLGYGFNSAILNIELNKSDKILKEIDLLIKDIKHKKISFKYAKPKIISKIKELKNNISNIRNISHFLKEEKIKKIRKINLEKNKSNNLDSNLENNKNKESKLIRTGNLEVKNLDTIKSKILTNKETQDIANYRFKANIDDIIIKELNFKILDKYGNDINEIIPEIKSFELVYNNEVINSRIALNSDLKFIIPGNKMIIPVGENPIVTVRANIGNIANLSSVTKNFKIALISAKIISKSTGQTLNDGFIVGINSFDSKVLGEEFIYSEDMLITNYKPLIKVNSIKDNVLTNSNNSLIFSFNVNSSDNFNSIFLKKFNLNISGINSVNNKIVDISSIEKNGSKVDFNILNNNLKYNTYGIEFNNLEEVSGDTVFDIYADISGFDSNDELSIFIESLSNTFEYGDYNNIKTGSFIWSNNKTIFYNSFGLKGIGRNFKIKLN